MVDIGLVDDRRNQPYLSRQWTGAVFREIGARHINYIEVEIQRFRQWQDVGQPGIAASYVWPAWAAHIKGESLRTLEYDGLAVHKLGAGDTCRQMKGLRRVDKLLQECIREPGIVFFDRQASKLNATLTHPRIPDGLQSVDQQLSVSEVRAA
jgi:hypothetical protein